jgi:tripartite-type tricarboxylate transporter receptor subunit TctC
VKFKYFLLPLVIFFNTVNAQEWPNKPIKIISPYPAGGSNDSVTRLISDKLSPKLKQTVTVENIPGKDGIIASEIVAKSKPDGYNFVMLASPHTANHHFYEKLPYETLTEFTPIVQVVKVPLFLLVPANSPIMSVNDLLAAAAKQPSILNISTTGVGGGPHLALMVFKSLTKADVNHAPYLGDTPALADMKADKVDAGIHPIISALPDIKTGKLRAIAVFGSARSPLLPEVPSLGEMGYLNTEVYAWFGLAGPAKLPKQIVSRLNKDVNDILEQADVKQKLADMGMVPLGGTAEQYKKFIHEDFYKWKTLAAKEKLLRIVKPKS